MEQAMFRSLANIDLQQYVICDHGQPNFTDVCRAFLAHPYLDNKNTLDQLQYSTSNPCTTTPFCFISPSVLMEANTRLRPSVLSLLTEKLGYPLQAWQKELTENILKGKDVVLTAGTGRGKTTLLYAPLLVTRLHKPQAIGLSVVSTKALGLDQVCFSLVLNWPSL